MLNDNAKKWVAALRSGNYDQTTYQLVVTNSDSEPTGYCCLGVACDLYAQDNEIDVEYELEPHGEFGFIRFGHESTVLPPEVREWLGLRERTGGFEDGRIQGESECHSLADLNDAGATFKQVADFIESEPKGLFA